MICDLTGLDVANASLLDEATAAAEAMALCQRQAKSKATAFFVDAACHPQTIALIQTRAEPLGWTVVVGNRSRIWIRSMCLAQSSNIPARMAMPMISPADCPSAPDRCCAAVASDLLALTLLKSPGEMGADIAIGSSQRFGVPMGYGGPHAAFMAVKDAHKRSMPGRLVACRSMRAATAPIVCRCKHANSISAARRRLQHLHGAGSAGVMASMYGVFHGPEGLKAIAQQVHRKAVLMAKGLEKLGYTVEPEAFFDTITVEVGHMQGLILRAAVAEGVNLRKVGATKIGMSLDERTRPNTLEAVWRAFGGNFKVSDFEADYRLPADLLRTSPYMTHPIFHMNRAESEMTRYIRRLSDRDLALDRAMIPLGSCTMKLNATAEMLPITWPEFSDMHPFAPVDQAEGYRK